MAKSDIVLDDELIDLQGRVSVRPNGSSGDGPVQIFPGRGNVRIGGAGAEGDLVVQDEEGENHIHLDGGGNNAGESPAAVYADKYGSLTLGRKAEQNDELISHGSITLKDFQGERRIAISGGASPRVEGIAEVATEWIDDDDDDESGPLRVLLDGDDAVLELGGDGVGGDFVLRDPETDPEGGPRIHLSTDPEKEPVEIQDSDGSTVMTLTADGDLRVQNVVVADDVDLLETIEELEERIEELEDSTDSPGKGEKGGKGGK